MNLNTKASMAQQDFFADVQSLQQLKNTGQKQTKEGLEKVAKEFESLYLKMMLDSMRKAEDVWSKDNPFSSQEQTMFRDMLDSQYAKELSAQGSLGLADMLVKQLSPFLGLQEAGQQEGGQAPEMKMQGLQKQNPGYSLINENPAFQLQHQNRTEINQFQLMNTGKDTIVQPEILEQSHNEQQILNQQQMQAEESDVMQKIANADGDPDKFIELLLPLAQKPAQDLGVDPKLLVAQAALETGWGKSLQRNNHGFNLFGIKGSSDWQGQQALHPTHEIYDGKKIQQQASFKVYDSPESSFQDYVNLIKKRYINSSQNTLSPESYTNSLVQGGYATDPDYADKILAIYNSRRFEQAQSQETLAQADQTLLASVNTSAYKSIPGVNYSKIISQIW